MSNPYRLHCFAQSGNAYKVALMLQALAQPWTPVHMPFGDFAKGVQRSDDWRTDVNAMGERTDTMYNPIKSGALFEGMFDRRGRAL